jgi:hypothetical protein
LEFQRFAHNTTFEQAFVDGIAGFNRPTNVRLGPDSCAYVADYGAVRDFRQSDPETKYRNPADAGLPHIPGTGVIWKICPQQRSPRVGHASPPSPLRPAGEGR